MISYISLIFLLRREVSRSGRFFIERICWMSCWNYPLIAYLERRLTDSDRSFFLLVSFRTNCSFFPIRAFNLRSISARHYSSLKVLLLGYLISSRSNLMLSLREGLSEFWIWNWRTGVVLSSLLLVFSLLFSKDLPFSFSSPRWEAILLVCLDSDRE